ncbi:MAG TPA: branched-chain amino acid transaminase [Vicinamibacteria bacterium]|nr:branched-chain amino acid transaminase [Vicinamibacteria bacterium]
MASPRADFIWMSGTLVPWDDARIHIGSHVVHYGSAVFEGIRCYKTTKGPAVFRLDAHTERLFNSAKIYWMDLRWTEEQVNAAVVETIQANRLDACYIRPVVYRGAGQLGVNPLGSPVELSIMVWDWGKYLGKEALEQGVDVCVSSWTRMAPNTLPAMAKSAGNYVNSQLIKVEAVKGGFAEGIALDTQGYVSEGSGENLFAVVKGRLVTPPLVSSILPGITRDSVLTLARRLGIAVDERALPREVLYLADELFFTGTAAEITPIRSVDRQKVGTGARGPVTKALQEAFFDAIEGGQDEDGWLTFVPALAGAASGGAR